MLVASAANCVPAQIKLTIPRANLQIVFIDPPGGQPFVYGQSDNQNRDPQDLTFIRDVAIATTAASDSSVSLAVNDHGRTAETLSLTPSTVYAR